MNTWKKPELVEIKMDAEISSYQDDSYDPAKYGPLFTNRESDQTRVSRSRHEPRA